MIRTVSTAVFLLFGAAVLAGPAGFNPERLGRLIKVCTKGANVTRELVEGYKRLEFPADPVTKCVMRCIGLNMGVYDDLTGVHMDATWQMFRSGRTDLEKKAYVDEHLGCIRGNLKSLADDAYCERVYGSYLCYKEEFERLTMGAAKSKKN
ncbi:hypothetical protein pipiens_004782 [Culex pipiens pipiens]|uniref:Uncharacterized protein n=1 Tax=Culex pipiens pipiens TaxID=38569 RepID=A0ABD1CF45_CULPP